MRIWILSDLHVDAAPWTPPEIPPHDVCIVAGDVRDGLVRSLGWLVEHVLPRSPVVVYVPGNHDYYGHRWQSELARGRDVAAANGIRLLALGEVLVQGRVRIIGATLWTDYAVGEPRWPRVVAMAACGDRLGGMRDHRKIKERTASGETNAFRPAAALREHAAQRARIEEALAQPHEDPTVVVTHHAPSPRSLRRGVPDEPIDAAYGSDLSSIMEGPHAPNLWLHGHVHASRDYRVGRTRIVANPRGHDTSHRTRAGVWVDERENPAFDPLMTVEI